MAALEPGSEDRLKPAIQIELMADERVELADRRPGAEDRLRAWIAGHIAGVLASPGESGRRMPPQRSPRPCAGIVFLSAGKPGFASAAVQIEHQVDALSSSEDRLALARWLDIRLGVGPGFHPSPCSNPPPPTLRGKPWIAAHRPQLDAQTTPALISRGRLIMPSAPTIDPGFCAACGYQPIGSPHEGGAAYRVDMLERFAAEVRKQARTEAPAKSDVFARRPACP